MSPLPGEQAEVRDSEWQSQFPTHACSRPLPPKNVMQSKVTFLKMNQLKIFMRKPRIFCLWFSFTQFISFPLTFFPPTPTTPK